MNSAQDLIPGNTDWPFRIEIVEAAVELDTLSGSKWKHLRHTSEAVPQVLEEAEPFLWCQRFDVEVTLTHGGSIASSPTVRSMANAAVSGRGEHRAADRWSAEFDASRFP